MTKISQLSSIGDSLAIGDQFLIRDIDDAGSPNKSVTVSGITRALADGDATAPALAFAADKNTGIYRAGTDSLAVATNGTGRLFVDANGNVYLNATVNIAPTNVSSYIAISNAFSDANIPGIGFDLRRTTNGEHGHVFWSGRSSGGNPRLLGSLRLEQTDTTGANAGGALILSTNPGTTAQPSERLRIDSSGRLLVGTSSSSADTFFRVQGKQSSSASNGVVQIARGQTNPSSDNGLGHIQFTDAAGSIGASIIAETELNWGASDYPSRLIFSTTADNASSPTERLRITSAGLVGIGTSAPNATLTVIGGPLVDGSFFPSGNLIGSFASSVGDAELITFGNSSLTASTFTMAFVPRRGGSTGAQQGWYQKIDSTSSAAGSYTLGTLQRAASGGAPETPRFHITSAGLVGIGTTSPGQALEVLGTIYSQNNATTIVHFQAADTGAATDEKTWRIVQSQRAAKSIQLGIAVNDASSVANAAITIVRSGATLDNIQFATGSGSERARIDSSGRLLVGTTTTSATQGILCQATASADGAILLARNSAPSATQTLGYLAFSDNGHVTTARIAALRDSGTWTAGSSQPSALVFSTTADGSASPTERLRITSAGVLQIADAGNITVGTTTGTKIGTATTQKIGFYNATPVVQPTAVADATDAASGLARLNDLLARLRTLGIIAT